MSGVDRRPVAETDVCVIGTGPAGTFVGYTLAEAGYDVVFLEAGQRFDLDEPGRTAEQLERAIRPEIDTAGVWEMGGSRDVFAADIPPHVDFDLNERRVKAVGGTSLMWHGTVMRLPEKDFASRSTYGVGRDWPISYGDLAPYYAVAEREIGVAGEEGPLSPPRAKPFPMEAFPQSATDERYIEACEELDIAVQPIPHARNVRPYDGRAACEGYATCSPFCPSSARYVATVHLERAEEAGATIIDRAVVQRLEHDDGGKTIDAVVYRTPDEQAHRQTATQFVLACGPVETPRLLFLSATDSHPDGLANRSGALGRYFQASPYISTTARLDEPTQPEQTGFDTTMSYEFYEPVDDDRASIWMTFRNEDPTPVVERVLRGGARHARDELLTEIRGNPWGDALLERIRAGDPAEFANLRISSYVEQLPRAENRVTLDESRTDSYDNPVPKLTYSFDDRIEHTMAYALDIHREIFEEIGAEITHEEAPLQRIGNDHKGTTRMGADPDESVVDATGRTHDLENLWIAGPSVFPTGGAVLPVLTVIALAIKTADHLTETLE